MPLGKFIHYIKGGTKRVYLDYAAATPVHPDVYEAMVPYFAKVYGNPSAIHREGQEARGVVEHARKRVARTLAIRPEGVLFTSGGTESNNLAISGVVEAVHAAGRAYEDMEVISTKIEHLSVIETLKRLEQKGVNIVWLPVDDEGLVQAHDLESLLSPNTVLVTIAYVNSEVGVEMPIKQITRTVRAYNKKHDTHVLTHTDAAQAPLWLPCELDKLGVDMLSLDTGKCYGPKGMGVLAMRHGVQIAPQMGGGGQELALRPGTENVPLIVGGALALTRAQDTWEDRAKIVRRLRDILLAKLEKEVPGVVLNGSREHRVANNVNISIPGIDSEFLVVSLDIAGIAASTKSACSGASGGGSTVVREITGDEARATSTVRFSLGEDITEAELERTVVAVKTHAEKMQHFEEKGDVD